MSTFSGIGAASISFPDPGYFHFVAYAEIAPFQAHVLHYRCGASRPKYMPDPNGDLSFLPEDKREKEHKARKKAIKEISGLPEKGRAINWGDITQITDDDLKSLGRVDVLEGGSPCQAFSFAGARRGLEDPRGNLMLAFCDLAERMHKINGLRYVVWENVHGALSIDGGRAFGSLLASLAGEEGGALQPPRKGWTNAGHVRGAEGREVVWRTVDSQHWGIPQRRKRIFVVANFGWTAKRLGAPEAILFESESLSWDSSQGQAAQSTIVSTYRRGDRVEYRSAESRLKDPDVQARLEAIKTGKWDEHAVYALADDYDPKASPDIAYALMAGSPTGGGHKQLVVHPRVSGTLMASGAGVLRPAGVGSETDFVVVTKPENDPDPEHWIVRKFTPLECERLQGFPDHWTDVPFRGKLAPDGPRYRAIGNSMPCPVMAFIGQQLMEQTETAAMLARRIGVDKKKDNQ
jgi:DNA (cytosine-5)-methyltransferase 1